MLLEKIDELLKEVSTLTAQNAEEVEQLRIKYLSKKGEINALMMLSIMEERDEIVRPGMLAACSHATPGAVSQTLKSLEEKGLIVRRRGEGDSRSVTISLTDAGHEFEKEGRRLHDERFMHMLEFLGEDDAREFVRIVNRMLEFEESHPWKDAATSNAPRSEKEGGEPCA